jgi:shikimate 5-dehydrogenase
LQLAYQPLETPLLRQIRIDYNRNWTAIAGLDILPEQGFSQFEMFTGVPAPRQVMRAVLPPSS